MCQFTKELHRTRVRLKVFNATYRPGEARSRHQVQKQKDPSAASWRIMNSITAAYCKIKVFNIILDWKIQITQLNGKHVCPCADCMCVYFTFLLPLLTSSHDEKTSSDCRGGRSVIRHKFKDHVNRGISFNRILCVISVRDCRTSTLAVSLASSQIVSLTQVSGVTDPLLRKTNQGSQKVQSSDTEVGQSLFNINLIKYGRISIKSKSWYPDFVADVQIQILYKCSSLLYLQQSVSHSLPVCDGETVQHQRNM